MSDRSLRLQVVFAALDRLSAPIRQLQAGSRGLARSLAETQGKIAQLNRTQLQIGQFKGAEGRLRRSAEELETARARTAALRQEISQVGAPTRRMTQALAAAERAEAALGERHQANGRRLQELSRRLGAAGIDVTDLANHERRLERELRDTNRQLEEQRARLERLQRVQRRGQAISGAGGKMMGAGAIMSASVTAPVVATIVSAIPEAIGARKAAADVGAALASMGTKAGRSLEQLDAQAEQLQSNSLFDDDDIMKQVTANMLTFGNVSGTVFDRAQLAAVNLTARLGGDLQSRAIMVGKALQDPVKGITALGRAGVSLDEQQKQQIETWVKTGQTAKAQELILGELEKQYGRAAAAQREADPTGAMQQDWRALQEDIGETALVVLPSLSAALKSVTSAFQSLSPEQRKYLVLAAVAIAALGPIIMVIGGALMGFGAIMSGVSVIAGVFGISMLAAFGWIAVVIAAIAALGYAVYLIYKNWGPITAFFGRLWTGIKSGFVASINWLRSLIPSWSTVGKMMLQGLLSALNPVTLVGHVLKLGGAAIKAIKAVLGIKSPSRVFAAIGGHMMTGLQMGLDRGADGPLTRIRKAGGELTAALSSSVLLTAPAASAPAAIAGAPRTATAAVGPLVGQLHVHPSPGMDERALADLVMQKIRELQRGDDASRRATFEDID